TPEVGLFRSRPLKGVLGAELDRLLLGEPVVGVVRSGLGCLLRGRFAILPGPKRSRAGLQENQQDKRRVVQPNFHGPIPSLTPKSTLCRCRGGHGFAAICLSGSPLSTPK